MTKVFAFDKDGLDCVELDDKTRLVISAGVKYREGVGVYLPIDKYWPIFEKQLWGEKEALCIWLKPNEVTELISGLRLIRDSYDASRDK